MPEIPLEIRYGLVAPCGLAAFQAGANFVGTFLLGIDHIPSDRVLKAAARKAFRKEVGGFPSRLAMVAFFEGVRWAMSQVTAKPRDCRET